MFIIILKHSLKYLSRRVDVAAPTMAVPILEVTFEYAALL